MEKKLIMWDMIIWWSCTWSIIHTGITWAGDHLMQVIMQSKILSTKPISISYLQRKTVPTLALLFNCYIVNLTIAKFSQKNSCGTLKSREYCKSLAQQIFPCLWYSIKSKTKCITKFDFEKESSSCNKI